MVQFTAAHPLIEAQGLIRTWCGNSYLQQKTKDFEERGMQAYKQGYSDKVMKEVFG